MEKCIQYKRGGWKEIKEATREPAAGLPAKRDIVMILKKFPLPKPGAVRFTYCKIPIEGAPRTGMMERRFYDCGYCAGCDERHPYMATASVEGFPFLCEDCYRMVYKYSCFTTDPYGIKRMGRDEEVSIATTRKVINSGRNLERIEQNMTAGLMYEQFRDDEED